MRRYSVVLGLLTLCVLLSLAACKNLAGPDTGEETSRLYRGNEPKAFSVTSLA